MDPLTVGAGIVLGVVMAIFVGISMLGLMGRDSSRW